MMANSFTIMRHPPELIAFMQSLADAEYSDHQFGRVPRWIPRRRQIL